MGFAKVVKNKAYFKRFQVKYRRRREGKTDYYARQRLICQDKSKYNSPKYRLVVRITNHDIIVQVIHAQIVGDVCICAAYAHELKQERYGLPVGLTNYSAAYCTGLLCARRLLRQFGIDQQFQGTAQFNEKFEQGQFEQAAAKDKKKSTRRPFKVLLDVGLARTVTGAKVFAAMKGAIDGGLKVPHKKGKPNNTKRLPPTDALRSRIYGGHVADYMKHLKKTNEAKYNKQFSQFVEAGIGGGDLERLYTTVHANIRRDPTARPKREARAAYAGKKPRMTLAARKGVIRTKIAAHKKSLLAAEDSDE
jgi:large subunit ribosomal protein L5e